MLCSVVIAVLLAYCRFVPVLLLEYSLRCVILYVYHRVVCLLMPHRKRRHNSTAANNCRYEPSKKTAANNLRPTVADVFWISGIFYKC